MTEETLEKVGILKSAFQSAINAIPVKDVALFLSGGLDSRNCLYALEEANKNIHAYTFHMEGIESTDLLLARKIAENHKIELTEISVPSDIESIKKYLVFFIHKFKETGKANIECCYPMYHAIPIIKESYVVQGVDGNFFLDSKKAALHYSQSLELSNEYRWIGYNNHAQRDELDGLCAMLNPNLKFVRPFYEKNVFDCLCKFTYDEMTKPHLKACLEYMYRDAFLNEDIKTYVSNYQKGDSGIADAFNILMKTDWAKGKSVQSIYNAIERRELPPRGNLIFGKR